MVVVAFHVYFDVTLPQYSGKVLAPGIQDTVDIFTDEYGVPHIFANGEEDLFYAAGYTVAGERLFQMSIIASAARGELSLFLGNRLVKRDVYLRTFGIPEVSKRTIDNLDKKTLNLLKIYCKGINDRIDSLEGDFPVEFKLLRTSPVYWKPSDIIGYLRLMAHDLQQSWKGEIVLGALAEKFGAEKVKSLFPMNVDEVTIVPPMANLSQLYHEMSSQEKFIRDLTQMEGSVMGSNNWVISGERTASGKPILANDPHLGYPQPAKWYEMHLKGGDYNISGVCLPGIPLPPIGQNETCAWGFTNVMIDDIDFFIETIHPDNPDLYRHDNEWRTILTREEVIPLASGKDTTITIRSTHHGPIISDIHPRLKGEKHIVSMSWMGHRLTEETTAMMHLAKIKNWDDFTEAVKLFSIPGQNIVYADIYGNIGWRPAVKIPLRKNAGNLLPRPGEDSSYDWKGFVPFNEMPTIFNPKEGFIATANNKTVDSSFPYYISNQWANPSRITRIREMILQKDDITVEDVKAMHADRLSTRARWLTPYFLNAVTKNEREQIITAYNLLASWDYIESPESAAALIYHTAYNHLFRNIYGDEMAALGEGFLEDFVSQPMVPSRSLKGLLLKGQSEWFDDISTPEIETMNDMLRKSLLSAVDEIEKKHGKNSKNWAWGRVHTLTHNHSLGRKKLLDVLFGFNVGPFINGGSSETVNKGEYLTLGDFTTIVGPSMRRIVDFENLNNTQFVLPTGQSGLPTSPHYKDQAELYNSGEYRTTLFDEETIRSSTKFRHLELIPQ